VGNVVLTTGWHVGAKPALLACGFGGLWLRVSKIKGFRLSAGSFLLMSVKRNEPKKNAFIQS
jgi:hypothetical protein